MTVILTLAMAATSLTTIAQNFENAHDAVRHMGIGWNLGNTLESCNYDKEGLIERTTDCSVRACETAWGQPQATRELMHKMAEAGFKTIRVPVTWYHSDDALAEFRFPEDSSDDHLLASVHSYIPWNWDQNGGGDNRNI